MKKLILVSMMLLLLSWSVGAQIATKPALGDGTGTNPYQIASLENLYWVSTNPNEWEKCFIQTADIDASATSGWFGGTGWVPIGTGSAPFIGFYNGQGHTISNLFINRPTSYHGLFGITGNYLYRKMAKIENIGVINVNFNRGISSGGLVGYNECGYITNCYSTGVVRGEFYYFGGLAGISTSISRIISCYSSVDVTGAGVCKVGGLVGYLGAGSEISNSYSRGSVTSKEENEKPDHPSRTGGLVGEIEENGVIKNCYSTGLVSGIGAVGGLVGYTDGSQIVTNSFWDTQTSGTDLSADGTGKSTAEMKTQSTFTAEGWDFSNIWGINAGNNDGYPDFILESNCTNGTIALISGYNTQTVCANTGITPIVYEVGGRVAGAFISPALPTGFSGYYNAANGTYTISGQSSSAVDYTYSVSTFGTASPCSEATVTGTITVNSVTPSVTILSNDNDNIICEGISLIFTATPNNTGGGTVSYTWKLNGLTVGTDQNNYETNTLANGDRVSCEISVTGGECLTSAGANSNEILMTVNPNLTPSVTITSSDADNTICENTEVTYTATPHSTGDGAVAYQWYYFSKSRNTLYDYDTWNKNTWTSNELEDGDEIYCKITVTGDGCYTSTTAASDKIIIDVYNTETRPSVTITSNPSGEICPGADVTFTATPENTEGGTVTYQWYFFCKRTNELYAYDSWTTNPMTIIELEEGDEVYCEITVTDAACFSSDVALSNKIIISEVTPPDAGKVIGENVIQIGKSTTLSTELPGGEWFCFDAYEEFDVATVSTTGVVTGLQAGTASIYYVIPMEKNSPCNFLHAITEFPITVISDIPPAFTACPENQTSYTAAGLSNAVVNYLAAAEGSPEPIITYEFSGATTGSGMDTGTGSTFNSGETNVTITASNGISPDVTCSFKVTVFDTEAPVIACEKEIIQTAGQGMCSAVVTVVPPTVTDNCDNHVLPVSNNELIKNGNFNAGISSWQDCGNIAEVNTEEFYIVPLPPKSSNYVAEIDIDVSLCQTISGLTAGDKYVLTFKATRRQNTSAPNPVSAKVTIDGGALSEVVTRTNTTFDLTPESFEFTATQETHKVTFAPYTDNTYVLGLVVDDVSVRSITYPVGTTTLVWTATDVYGNTNTCEQKIIVTDDEIPSVTCKDIDVTLGQDGTVSIEENEIDNGTTDNCTSLSRLEFDTDVTSFDCTDVGANEVEMKVADEYDNSSTCKAVVTVLPYTAATEVSVLPDPQQYSDNATFTATVSPASVESGCVAATHVTFWVGTQQMGPAVALSNGTASVNYPLTELPSYPSNGQMAPGSHEIKAVFSGVDPAFIVPDAAATLSITQENVVIDYIGTEIVGEANQNVNTTPVALRATITDINDGNRGDIRNARVRFEIDGSPVSGWLVPTLVNPSDLTQGIVSYVWDAPVPSSGYATYDITVNVDDNGYYNGSLDDVPVNVYRTSLNEFITGGGHVIPVDSKGEYASDPGRKTNFGFNVKWNKTMKNLQGNFNLILRRGSEIYQIKTNALSGLGIDGSNPCSHKAVLTAKANLNRVTGGVTETLMGNLSLQVTLTDNGEPGVTDRIGVTLYNGSTLLYSSSWPISSTEELTLVGGNILVNDGLICNASDITHTVITSGKNPSLTGEDVTFTATVYGHDATPQGSLIFKINGETFTGILDSKGSTLIDYGFVEQGTYEVEADYNSTNGYKPSTGTITQLVNGSSFTLSSSENPSVSGDEVTFTAVLNSTDAAPAGTVTFKVDGEEKAMDVPLTDKKAMFTTNLLSSGSHTIEAVYTSTNDPSIVVDAATLTQVVNNVNISLASSKNPSVTTETVVFTATVTGSASIGETITFFKDGSEIGSGIVDVSGNASVSCAFGTVGTYAISAECSGKSVTLNQEVINPVIVLSSSDNPATENENVIFTASVTGASEGTVRFTNGIEVYSTSLTDEKATWTISLPEGSYLIKAEYYILGNLMSEASLTQAVTAKNITVELVSSKPLSVVYGTNITYTATVKGSAAAPSGTVTFKDGTTTLKNVLISDDKASFSTNKLAAGDHSITATYNLTGTISNTISQTVTAKTKSAEIATGSETKPASLKVYPNPFDDRLKFEFSSPIPVHVRIEIYDMTGRMIETVFDQPIEGEVMYTAEFKPFSLVSAKYIYRVSLGKMNYIDKVLYKFRE